MRSFPCLLLLTILPFAFCQAATVAADSLDGYQRFQQISLNYRGYVGHTVGLDFGILEQCHDCKGNHRKYFGLGFETGFDMNQFLVFGPKTVYQRGDEHFGFRLSAFPFFNELKEFSLMLSGEILVYPFSGQQLSFSAGLSPHHNFTTKTNYDSFGILSLNMRFYIPVKRLD
ncbi:MAG: hypothetical protein GYB31_12060 [Bacteroidetes bacterium]|nr:hypothetical protein [Bacteroidota bacterium]